MNEKSENNRLTKTLKIILILFSLLLISEGYSQSITWQRLYEVQDSNRSVSKATCYADNGNFYSGGTAFLDGNWRIYVMKINPYGDTIWTRRIDSLGSEVFAIVPSGDGGCVITGDNHYTVKLNTAGSIVWAKYYGGIGIQLFDIIKTSDGGFIACGEFFDINNFTHNGYLMKLNNSGNMLWEKYYFTGNGKTLTSIAELANGSLAITGSCSDFLTDTGKVLLLKINSNGDSLWQKRFSLFSTVSAGHSIILKDNFFVIGGATVNSTGTYANTFLLRVDTAGNFMNAKKFEANRNEGFYDLKVINSNKYIFTRTRELPPLDSYVMLIDSMGNSILEKSFELQGFAILRSILPLSNGDFIFAGNGRTSANAFYKTYIIRADSLLNAPPIGINNISSNLPNDFILKQNYPNPFNSSTIIEFEINKSTKAEIRIFDLLGRFLSTLFLNTELRKGSYKIQFDANKYSSGVYIYQMRINGLPFTAKKMVILK